MDVQLAPVQDKSVMMNKDGVVAKPSIRSLSGGDTGVTANNLYYCGRQMDQCRCGECDGQCGPEFGCPCDTCVELVGFKVNSEGHLCKRGVGLEDSGDTNLSAESLYYCGLRKMKCRCGRCDGRCGPQSGCPCNACVELVGFKVNKEGSLCKKLNVEGEDPNSFPKSFYYCGKKIPCKCEPAKQSIKSSTKGIQNVTPNQNNIGMGSVPNSHLSVRCQCSLCSTIGSTNPIPSHLVNNLKDSILQNKFVCDNCDTVCAPCNGRPCNACLELVFELSERNGNEDTSMPSYPEENPTSLIDGSADFPPTTQFKLSSPQRKTTSNWLDSMYIQGLLGKGSFGFVFKANDKLDNSQAAIKFTFPDFAGTSDDREKIHRQTEKEYSLVIGIVHHNIATTFDFAHKKFSQPEIDHLFTGIDVDEHIHSQVAKYNFRAQTQNGSEAICIRMELCGPTLRNWLTAHTDLEKTKVEGVHDFQVGIVQGLIDGLRFLHSHKIMHRDMKPENIYFSRSDFVFEFVLPVKIGDFGLCRKMHGDESQTSSLTSKQGTPLYRAPELNTKEYSMQADLFSLGLIIWEVLQLIPRDKRRSLFDKLIYDAEEELVERHEKVVNSNEIIVLLTKRRVEQRLKSIDAVVLRLPKFVSNESEFRSALKNAEEGDVILLSRRDYQGNFFLRRNHVLVKAERPDWRNDITTQEWPKLVGLVWVRDKSRSWLSISADNCEVCFLQCDLHGSVGGYGIEVYGKGNKIHNMKFANLQAGIKLFNENNQVNCIHFENVKTGISFNGNRHRISDIKYSITNTNTGIAHTAIIAEGRNSTIERITCIGFFGHDKEFLMQTSGSPRCLLIEDCSAGPITLSGTDHEMINVNAGPLLTIHGAGHRLANCRAQNLHNYGLNIKIERCHFAPNFIDDEFSTSHSLGFDPIKSSIHKPPYSYTLVEEPNIEPKTLGSRRIISVGNLEELKSSLKDIQSGDIINLIAGVYDQPPSILTSSVTLRGKGSSTVIKGGLYLGSSYCEVSKIKFINGGIEIFGVRNRLSDLEIADSSSGVATKWGGRNILTNIRCQNVTEVGILLRDRENDVEGYHCDNVKVGIEIFGDSNVLKNMHYVKDSDLSQYSGVVVSKGKSNLIQDLHLQDLDTKCGDWGIVLQSGTHNTKVTKCDCVSLDLNGTDHTISNVSGAEVIKLQGSGHKLYYCNSKVWENTAKKTVIQNSNCPKELLQGHFL